MTWRRALAEALGLDEFAFGDPGATPFAVRTEGTITWRPPRLRSVSDGFEVAAESEEGLAAVWHAKVFPDTRSVECSGTVHNIGAAPVRAIRELWTLDLSIALGERWGEPWVRTFDGVRFFPAHFPPDDFRFHDRQMLRTPQVYTPIGGQASLDGRSSGGGLPFLVMTAETRDRGFALAYEWSGLWTMGVTQAATPGQPTWPWEVNIGAGIWGLSIDLAPGEALPLPNLLIAGFAGGPAGGGNILRRHISRHIAPGLGGAPSVPLTSFNHYFAFFNDFDAEMLKPAVRSAVDIGIEYFVVDAGWFQDGFRKGIGNWRDVDAGKFPDGVGAFSDWVTHQGIKYGTWFEPEYAHKSSTLFRAHPEWFLTGPHSSLWETPTDVHYPDGVRVTDVFDLGENFALMDFGQPEVQRYWVERIGEAYERWSVRWIRWDFNQPPRPYWDNNAPAGRVGLNQIRHVEGFYRVLDEIIAAFPDLVIEQCASGGYRIDLGTVRRGHTFWMNDHTTHSDIVRALQHGLNEVLPGGYANTNLCQFRSDYDEYDYLSHGGGSFGVSGRLWQWPAADRSRLAGFIERYKSYRGLLNADYDRPTGNPLLRTGRTEVAWSNDTATVEMRFNTDAPRSAHLRRR